MFQVNFYFFLGGYSLLENILHEHNRCCVMVHRMNINMRFICCVFYYISVPAIDLLIMLSIVKEVDIFNRILASIIAIIGVFVLFLFNYSMSLVSKAAHRPYNKLNSIIVRKPTLRRLNLKVVGLIEKLSGPVIGIYCLDLFPFTNYEFYLYISNCITNFILLINLFG